MSKIYLSPSTQEGNQYAGGTTGYTDSEEYWMRKVAFPVADLLRSAGHSVKVGGTYSLNQNCDEANVWMGANGHYYALHTNAGGGHGTETWYFTGSVDGAKMAKALHLRVSTESNQPDRGVKDSTYYGELRLPKSPSVICELLFHDNPTEAQEMRDDWTKFVMAITLGILDHVGGSIPVAEPCWQACEHMREHEINSAKASATARGNTIRFYKTAVSLPAASVGSWQQWPPSQA